MNTSILVAVIAYEVLLIGGIALWLTTRQKGHENDEAEFELGGRNLPLVVIVPTLALTVLGTAHILGIFEMSWFMGAASMWFGLANAMALAVVCVSTGIWARRMGMTTVPELLEQLYGEKVRIAVSCVMAGAIFGILTLETQGLGIILATMTGWSIQNGAILGGVFGVLYVIFAGIREVGWINLFNAVLMYISLILATYYIAQGLPNGDFSSVVDYYTSADQAHMLSIFGPAEIMLTFALGTVVAVVFSVPASQLILQVTMSAKDEKTIKNSLWWAVPLNGLFGVFTIALGLTAKSLPEFHTLGPKLAAPTMLIQMLPPWLAVMLIASFLAAVLSTFAMTCLGPATIFSHDIYKRIYRPDADERHTAKVTRISIIVLAAVAVAVAASLPPILAAIPWLLSWLIPVLWLMIAGLLWRASKASAALTLTASWLVNMLWTFTGLPAWMGLEVVPNAYVVLGVTVVVGFVSSLLLSGEQGYFRKARGSFGV